MAKIFMSYRRDDSGDASGRMYDRLEPKYGRENVFKDVDTIPLGVDFRRVLTDEVVNCDVMLVVIGRVWLNITDDHGYRRLDNPGDFVRIEVEAALAQDIPVIPVLVQNASLPQERDLPSSLAPLVYRNGISLRGDPYFHRDMDLLIGRLDTLLGAPKALGLSGMPAAAQPTPTGVWESLRVKREGGAFTEGGVAALVAGYIKGEVPDYQMSSLLMAIRLRGMSRAEIVAWTLALAASGDQLRIRERVSPVADNYSTGGVGDKVTLAVLPLVAACGLPVAQMSGRGLGHIGGTVDKLESISGFRTELGQDEFIDLLERHGLVISRQSSTLAPADGKLYALRDVTATVDSIPLIAASIMSKKLAIGPSHLLLDVKVGAGSFMKTEADARLVAETMAGIGEDAGVCTVALLSAMEQPLGRAVGNALEVAETVAILRGEGPEDVTQLCVHEVATMLAMAGLVKSETEGERRARKAISNGVGLAKLREVVTAQGGDPAQIDDPGLLPQARWIGTLEAPLSGYIAGIHAEKVGMASLRLGAGRVQKSDLIDPAVGLVLQAKVGDHVDAGQPLVEIHARTVQAGTAVRSALLAAYQWSEEPLPAPPLLLGRISGAPS
jgi:pyrimidine-nucleoside phosphorylase